MFVLFLPCLSRYDVHDDDDHDDNGVTLSWYPGVMRRIHTAAKWRESRAVENKTDVTEPPGGKNPHGTEAERIHNSAQQQERRDDDSDSCFHDSVVVDCFTFYADGSFYHIRFLMPPLPPPLCF